MSQYPNSVLKRGGFHTSKELRSSREKNVKKKCPFCPKELVFTCYGPHVFRHHCDELFSNTKEGLVNRKSLSSKKYTKEPLVLDMGDSPDLYGCLGCQSIFQKSTTAQNHFKAKKLSCNQLHESNLLELKDKYPASENTPAPSGKMKNRGQLQFFIESLIERVRELETKHKEEKMEYEDKYGDYFEDWEMDLREEELRKEWTFFLEERPKEPTPPSTPPSEPEDDDLIPLVVEKPYSLEQTLKKTLDDPTIDEQSKILLQQHVARQMASAPPRPQQTSAFPKAKRLAKQVDVDTPPPPPIIPSAPSVEEKKKTVEEQLAEIDAFRKKSRWQIFLEQNPGLTVQEQLQRASGMGLKPDGGSGFKIVGNTKRPLTQ